MEWSESFDSQACLLILVKTLQPALARTVSIGCEDRNL